MMDVVILAGGLGTRLRSVVSEVPKCMAPVAGRPFLWYLLEQLRHYSVRRVILSVGYLREAVQRWIGEHESEYPFEFVFAVENEPLGTGGGIRLAASEAQSELVHIAGKTGTAQLLIHGRYTGRNHRMTFVGYFPEENPQYTCICMIENPKNWQKHYHGSDEEKKIARKFSYSDRCRYYFSLPEIKSTIEKLFANIDSVEVPAGILSQFMPRQYLKVRDGVLPLKAAALVKDNVVACAEDYNYAVKVNYTLNF